MKTDAFPWLRLYADAVTDDKLMLLAFEDRWHFVAVLCLKRSGVLDSDAPQKDRRVAVKLGLQLSAAEEVKRRLMEVGLIGENWQPLAWGKRQFRSDAGSAERMRKHRNKKEVQRHCDVTVTSHVTKSDAPDLREEKIRIRKDTPPRARGSAEGERGQSPARARPAKRMPRSWEPSTDLLAWAATEAPLVDFRHALDSIRDHEFKTAHTDWDAVVRNWLRRDQRTAEDRLPRIAPRRVAGPVSAVVPPVFREDDDSMDGIEL